MKDYVEIVEAIDILWPDFNATPFEQWWQDFIKNAEPGLFTDLDKRMIRTGWMGALLAIKQNVKLLADAEAESI
jgi:hypothetical protein